VRVDLGVATPREREVLDLLGEHLTHEQIGRRLFISPRTVETHVAALRRKLQLPDHRALVRFAVEERAQRPAAPSPPAALTSFVGRRAELTELTVALQDARLVSVVGPGGAGKTRLAMAAVATIDAARWVDLAPVTDATTVEDGVAYACGAAPSSRLGPVDATVAALRGQRVLLVLDNCEHLVNAIAVLVERLLTACPELTVLVTSRVRLALSFERVFHVGGLSAEPDGDAVALFIERAVAAGGVAAHADRARISAVCEALGGLPLAVELAAVRLPSLGLDGVERGLLDQAGLLTGGARVSPRHRSMTETLDWSVALLDRPAATALRRLAVFVAPFNTDDAVAVAAFAPLPAAAVPAALIQLVEHNLLTASAAGGRMVHRMLEPVRQYGMAGMTAQDELAFTRHLRWCADSVDALGLTANAAVVGRIADDVRGALAWAGAQRDRVPAAHELCREFGLLLFRHGNLREAQARLAEAARLAPDGSAGAADLRDAAAIAKCRVLGEEALRLELECAGRGRTAGDVVAAALALCRAAEMLVRFPGMFAARPEEHPDELLREARKLAPRDARVTAAVAVARAGYAGTEGAPTPKNAEAALRLARAAGDAVLESSALDAVTASELFSGQVVRAHRVAVERVERLGSWHDPPAALELKDALHVATFCALGAGDLTTAMRMAQGQHELPFLCERRDLADDELMAPAALAGDWANVLAAGERFVDDWTAAGRPTAAGRGLAPAAVAMTHGLCGERDLRAVWLGVLAEIRGVAPADAGRGSGYGELFDAMVLLHDRRPADAFAVLTAEGDRGLYGAVFRQWTAAVTAEAAVLAGRHDAGWWLDVAAHASIGNPIATAITTRAAAVHSGDAAELAAGASRLERAGTAYQAERSRRLLADLTGSWHS
jgi:predicted ATPase/DNA-binding CsgD family transcriptional regulator